MNDLQEKISILEKQLQNGVGPAAAAVAPNDGDFAEKDAYIARIDELEQQLYALQCQMDEQCSNNQQQQHLSELEQQVNKFRQV